MPYGGPQYGAQPYPMPPAHPGGAAGAATGRTGGAGGVSTHQKSAPRAGNDPKGTARPRAQQATGRAAAAPKAAPASKAAPAKTRMGHMAPSDSGKFDSTLMGDVLTRSSQRAQRSGRLIQSCLSGVDKDCQALLAMEAEYKADKNKLDTAGPQYKGMSVGLHSPCLLLPRDATSDTPESRLARRLGCG